MKTRSFSAVLLAAGKSTRMGADKALLPVGNGRLWERQRQVLVSAGANEIFLSAREDQTWAAGAAGFASIVRDALPDRGPLSGMVAALRASSYPHVAVLAVDLPQISPAWFDLLREECGVNSGVAGRHGAWFEPLAAIYPRAILPVAQAALAAGQFSLQRLLAEAVEHQILRVREIQTEELPWFENWNSPTRQA